MPRVFDNFNNQDSKKADSKNIESKARDSKDSKKNIESNKNQESNDTTNIDKKLLSLRNNIDKIDIEIITLLHERFKHVKEIGNIKTSSKSNIYRPDREREIIKNLLKNIKKEKLYTLNAEIIEAIFYEIFAISRNLESPQKIAFLGPIGSYTHQAAESIFGPLSDYLKLSTISAVFDALSHKNAKYGVVPIENNTNGMVGECIDNLARHDFKIVKEIIMPIHHSFATKAQNLADIKRIYSKDIAFGQCNKFLLNYNLNNIERVAVSSTAMGAQMASSDPHSAAICSNIAAKLYALPIMFDNVQDSSMNRTRFVIISDFQNERGSHDKTSIFVTIKDFGKSGALFALLSDFKEANINITKIDSRPIMDKDGFKYGFYMDFQGHKDDENIKKIFKSRQKEIKWLGSYPSFE